MPYVSQLIGKPVTDLDGTRVGRIRDIIASVKGGMHHPEIVALEVRAGRQSLLVPFSEVAVLVAPAVPLLHKLSSI